MCRHVPMIVLQAMRHGFKSSLAKLPHLATPPSSLQLSPNLSRWAIDAIDFHRIKATKTRNCWTSETTSSWVMFSVHLWRWVRKRTPQPRLDLTSREAFQLETWWMRLWPHWSALMGWKMKTPFGVGSAPRLASAKEMLATDSRSDIVGRWCPYSTPRKAPQTMEGFQGFIRREGAWLNLQGRNHLCVPRNPTTDWGHGDHSDHSHIHPRRCPQTLQHSTHSEHRAPPPERFATRRESLPPKVVTLEGLMKREQLHFEACLVYILKTCQIRFKCMRLLSASCSCVQRCRCRWETFCFVGSTFWEPRSSCLASGQCRTFQAAMSGFLTFYKPFEIQWCNTTLQSRHSACQIWSVCELWFSPYCYGNGNLWLSQSMNSSGKPVTR